MWYRIDGGKAEVINKGEKVQTKKAAWGSGNEGKEGKEREGGGGGGRERERESAREMTWSSLDTDTEQTNQTSTWMSLKLDQLANVYLFIIVVDGGI